MNTWIRCLHENALGFREENIRLWLKLSPPIVSHRRSSVYSSFIFLQHLLLLHILTFNRTVSFVRMSEHFSVSMFHLSSDTSESAFICSSSFRAGGEWKLPHLIELLCISIPYSHLIWPPSLSHFHSFSHSIIIWLVNRFGCKAVFIFLLSHKQVLHF